jgi:hypothetical protein
MARLQPSKELSYAVADYEDAKKAVNDYIQKYNRPRIVYNPYSKKNLRRPSLPTQANRDETTTLREFGKFDDRKGYNGRVLSKYRIDSIVTAVFQHRKAFQQSKMQCIEASILKIDSNYKLAGKILVWTKHGQSFCPYKCIVTIHNEDGLTVFWKAL